MVEDMPNRYRDIEESLLNIIRHWQTTTNFSTCGLGLELWWEAKVIPFSALCTCTLELESVVCNIYLFIWGFTLLSTLYRSYHDG